MSTVGAVNFHVIPSLQARDSTVHIIRIDFDQLCLSFSISRLETFKDKNMGDQRLIIATRAWAEGATQSPVIQLPSFLLRSLETSNDEREALRTT